MQLKKLRSYCISGTIASAVVEMGWFSFKMAVRSETVRHFEFLNANLAGSRVLSNRRNGGLLEHGQSGPVLPSRSFRADPLGRYAGTTKTKVSSAKNRKAETGFHISADLRVWGGPFPGYSAREAAKELLGFNAQHAVRRTDERGEMPALIQAILQVFLLLLHFLFAKYLRQRG